MEELHQAGRRLGTLKTTPSSQLLFPASADESLLSTHLNQQICQRLVSQWQNHQQQILINNKPLTELLNGQPLNEANLFAILKSQLSLTTLPLQLLLQLQSGGMMFLLYDTATQDALRRHSAPLLHSLFHISKTNEGLKIHETLEANGNDKARYIASHQSEVKITNSNTPVIARLGALVTNADAFGKLFEFEPSPSFLPSVFDFSFKALNIGELLPSSETAAKTQANSLQIHNKRQTLLSQVKELQSIQAQKQPLVEANHTRLNTLAQYSDDIAELTKTLQQLSQTARQLTKDNHLQQSQAALETGQKIKQTFITQYQSHIKEQQEKIQAQIDTLEQKKQWLLTEFNQLNDNLLSSEEQAKRLVTQRQLDTLNIQITEQIANLTEQYQLLAADLALPQQMAEYHQSAGQALSKKELTLQQSQDKALLLLKELEQLVALQLSPVVNEAEHLKHITHQLELRMLHYQLAIIKSLQMADELDGIKEQAKLDNAVAMLNKYTFEIVKLKSLPDYKRPTETANIETNLQRLIELKNDLVKQLTQFEQENQACTQATLSTIELLIDKMAELSNHDLPKAHLVEIDEEQIACLSKQLSALKDCNLHNYQEKVRAELRVYTHSVNPMFSTSWLPGHGQNHAGQAHQLKEKIKDADNISDIQNLLLTEYKAIKAARLNNPSDKAREHIGGYETALLAALMVLPPAALAEQELAEQAAELAF